MSDCRVFRWLHLSDFHVGKDEDGESSLFTELLLHVDKQCEEGSVPKVIFLTGDLAFSGKSNQYTQFRDQLLTPLLDALEKYQDQGWLGRIYAVPGNHDVDRDADYANRDSILRRAGQNLFRITEDGRKARAPIIDRFAGFREMSAHFAGSPTDWLAAVRPSFIDQIEVEM